MTDDVVLTENWQEIAGAGAKLATYEIDGVAHSALSTLEPTENNYKTVYDGDSHGGVTDDKLWARLADSESSGSAKVDKYSSSVSFGLLNVAPQIYFIKGK